MPAEPHAATCAGCGLLCDDIVATVGAAGIEHLERTCARGDAWFAARSGDRPPLARQAGVEAAYEDALDAAASILAGARAPLIHGLGDVSIEAQRAAVALAELTGATIDPAGASAAPAVQAVGGSTATLGDVRDRAEVVVLWREDPAATTPRLLERLRLPRAGRTLVAVGAAVEGADVTIDVAPEDDQGALVALRALVAGRRVAGGDLPLEALTDLAARLTGAGNVALLHGAGLAARPDGHRLVLALQVLVRTLQDHTHAVTLTLRGEGNAAGASDVLTWQTGYPSGVDFALGHPRFDPGEHGAAAALARGDADAVLLVGSEAAEGLPVGPGEVPLVCLDHCATAAAERADVAFVAAAAGVHVDGTAHRMDSVPVPLPALIGDDRPAADDVLTALAERVRARGAP